MNKLCPRCKEIKDTSLFCKCKTRKDGLDFYCKACKAATKTSDRDKIRDYNRAYRAANVDRCRGYFLKSMYGITLEDYDEMLEMQDSGCAICGGINADGKRLHVDHCHDTGQVRGLLCHSCNTSLGGFRDDPELMRRAAIYVEEARV